MRVIVDFCLIPIGVGVSVSEEVAAVEKLIRDSGLKYQLHGYGTNIEGPWDEVFALIKQCHEELHKKGTVRISSTLRVGTRTDKEQGIQDKIDKVENLLK